MFKSIDDIKKANKALGHHWFDRDTMEFFRSRLDSGVMHDEAGNTYFVSSERENEWSERMYSIRVANEVGDVTTLGGFMVFTSASEAWEAIEEHIEHMDAYYKCNACQ